MKEEADIQTEEQLKEVAVKVEPKADVQTEEQLKEEIVKEEPKVEVQTKEADGKFQDEKFRKLFIGALSLSTTSESLKEFYAQYGTIVDAVVMFDPMSRKSRGFGFVTFSSMDEVDNAMRSRPHTIDGKAVDPKRAVPREDSQRSEANVSTKRLYVNGIREDHEEADFQEYFSKYGTVERVEIIKDKATGQYRGFAFISFNDFDPVDKCVLERRHMVKNHRCDVKKALSKEEISRAQQMERDRATRATRSRGTSRNSRGGMQNPSPFQNYYRGFMENDNATRATPSSGTSLNRGGMQNPSPFQNYYRGLMENPSPRGYMENQSPRGYMENPNPSGHMESPSPFQNYYYY